MLRAIREVSCCLGGIIPATLMTALLIAAVASVINMVTLLRFAAMPDKAGRRPLLLAGLFNGAVLFDPAVSIAGSGETAKMAIGCVLGYGLIAGILVDVISPFISEQFAASARYTGASIGYQLGATLGGGFAP